MVYVVWSSGGACEVVRRRGTGVELGADVAVLDIGGVLCAVVLGGGGGGCAVLLCLRVLDGDERVLPQLLELLQVLACARAGGLVPVGEGLGRVALDVLEAARDLGVFYHGGLCWGSCRGEGALRGVGERRGVRGRVGG